MVNNDNVITFEDVFGPETVRPTLFGADDEEYNDFRQDIINAPEMEYDHNKLPFNDVQVDSFDHYLRKKTINEAIVDGHIIYHISDKIGTDAIGYFATASNQFIVLASSTFILSSYSESLINKTIRSFSQFLAPNGKKRTLIKNFIFPSASLAACILSGERTDFSRWIEPNGKGLASSFPYFNEEDTAEVDRNYIPRDYQPIPPNKEEDLKVKESVISLDDLFNEVETNHHLFFIKKEGICDATGYFDEKNKYFYICKDSIISSKPSLDFLDTIGTALHRFVSCVCSKENYGYRVNRDAKIRDANVAACYVCGDNVDFRKWRDKRGHGLADIYPNNFSLEPTLFDSIDFLSFKPVFSAVKPESQSSGDCIPPSIIESIVDKSETEGAKSLLEESKNTSTAGAKQQVLDRMHFSLSWTDSNSNAYTAAGNYNATTKEFSLDIGSICAMNVAKGLEYTQFDFYRRKQLMNGTSKHPLGYLIQKLKVCKSPELAALLVTGLNPDEAVKLWKNDQGKSLVDIYM